MFRLGDDMVARLPRIERAVGALTHEERWLPVLASHLPLAVPTSLASGSAGHGYPWRWAVYSWLDGDNAFEGRIDDMDEAARELAGFIGALHAIDTADAPPSGRGRRGAPLAVLDQQTRQAIEAARGLVDRETVTAAWEAAMGQPSWHRDPVWVHGDIARGNLLVHGGRIRAVIDFGCSGVGDPACDLLVAWDLFDAHSRGVPGSGERRRRHVGTGPRLGSVHGALGASVLPPHEPRDGRPSPTQARRSARGHALTWANTGDPPGMSHPLAMMST